MHPILKILTLSFTCLTFWMIHEAFKYFLLPRLKAWLLVQKSIYKAIKLHKANQLGNKLKALKNNEVNKLKALKNSEVLDVVAEEVNPKDGPLVWQVVKYNERKTKHIVLEIKKPLQIE